MTTACRASASARARSPAPSARLIAEETPPPIAPADSICISMIMREHQRDGRQRRGAEDADVDGLADRHQRDRPAWPPGWAVVSRSSAGRIGPEIGSLPGRAADAGERRVGGGGGCIAHGLAYIGDSDLSTYSDLPNMRIALYCFGMAASYGQARPVARALDVIGEKWSLLDPARSRSARDRCVSRTSRRACRAWRRTRSRPASRRWRRRA